MRALKRISNRFYYATYDAEKKVYAHDVGDNIKMNSIFKGKMTGY